MPSIRRGMRLAEVALGCSIWRGLLSILPVLIMPLSTSSASGMPGGRAGDAWRLG